MTAIDRIYLTWNCVPSVLESDNAFVLHKENLRRDCCRSFWDGIQMGHIIWFHAMHDTFGHHMVELLVY